MGTEKMERESERMLSSHRWLCVLPAIAKQTFLRLLVACEAGYSYVSKRVAPRVRLRVITKLDVYTYMHHLSCGECPVMKSVVTIRMTSIK